MARFVIKDQQRTFSQEICFPLAAFLVLKAAFFVMSAGRCVVQPGERRQPETLHPAASTTGPTRPCPGPNGA